MSYFRHRARSHTDASVGTTIAAIVSLLVASGDQRVSTKTAFTDYENNSGWSNSTFISESFILWRMFTRGVRWMGIYAGLYGAHVDAHWL